MVGPRLRNALVLLATMCTLVASAPCACSARPMPQQARAHTCCPRSGADQTPAPDHPGGGRHAPCPHCTVGQVVGRNAAASEIGPSLSSPVLALAPPLPPVLLAATRNLSSRRSPPAVLGVRLCVVFRSLLL